MMWLVAWQPRRRTGRDGLPVNSRFIINKWILHLSTLSKTKKEATWNALGRKTNSVIIPPIRSRSPNCQPGWDGHLTNNMADSTRSDNSRPLLTKQDLLDCFATKVFAQHVTAAMSHDIGKLISSVNANKQAVQEQQQHLAELRGVVSLQQKHLETQAQQIKELSTMKTKIENKERRVQQKNLIITGLSETDPKNHLLRLIRENLNIQIHENDFSLTTKEARKRPTNAEESRAQSTSGSDVNMTCDLARDNNNRIDSWRFHQNRTERRKKHWYGFIKGFMIWQGLNWFKI